MYMYLDFYYFDIFLPGKMATHFSPNAFSEAYDHLYDVEDSQAISRYRAIMVDGDTDDEFKVHVQL